MHKKTLFALLSLTLSTSLFAHSGATGIVKERMEGFKAAKKSMKVLKSAVRNSEFSIIAREAQRLNLWFGKLDSYFPEGSNPKPSEALDRIWEEYERFSSLGRDSSNASSALLRAADQGNTDSAREAFFELAGSCKACHDDYRE